MDLNLPKVKGDFSSLEGWLKNLERIGFQSTHLGKAVKIYREILRTEARFLSFTANLVASGLRELLAEMVKEGHFNVLVTTAGAIEHDFIKAFSPYYVGSFDLNDAELHEKGINRLGNLLVPSQRYVLFEEHIHAVFERLLPSASPSEIAREMGKYLEEKGKGEGSFLYWAYKKGVPVFVPGITDGATGLQAFFFKQKHPEFSIDVTKDMKDLADIVLRAESTGALILGGGISKHHVIGANIVRGGLDYAVYITTAVEWDGSLSGARTREAVSWGKIKDAGSSITVYGDATLLLPLLWFSVKIAETKEG